MKACFGPKDEIKLLGRYSILEDAPFPKLCHVKKWPDHDGYGFELQGKFGVSGHFIGHVTAGSPAEYAGLCEGDRLLEVNGINTEAQHYRVVVEGICSNPQSVTLLVADDYTCNYYKSRSVGINMKLPNVRRITNPDSPPKQAMMKPRFCLLKNWSDDMGYEIQWHSEEEGLVVARVYPDSPAEYGGLKSGDRLVEVNDVPIYDKKREEEEIKYALLLLHSNPSELKLLVVEERNHERFVDLRRKGIYKDELIETIECPIKRPKFSKQIAFTLKSSSVALDGEESTEEANQNRSNEDFAGGRNGVEECPEIVPEGMKKMKKKKTVDSKEDPISLKYCEIHSDKEPLRFGFNVVSENSVPGSYFDIVERASPAMKAGLLEGHYIVAVNGALVYKDDHEEVIRKIRKTPSLIKIICTDRSCFEKIYDKSENEVKALINETFCVKTPPRRKCKRSSTRTKLTGQNIFTGTIIGGLRFSSTVEEARRKVNKKKDFKNTGMNVEDKFKLANRL